MRRSLLLLLVLALVPAASAQSSQFTPTMEISHIEVGEVSDDGVAEAEVYVVFECPFTTPDFMSSYVLELDIHADRGDVVVAGAATRMLNQACFSPIPGQSVGYELIWNLTLDGSGIYEDATVLFEVFVDGHSDGTGPFYGSPEPASADFAVKYQAQPDPAMIQNDTAQPIPQEETTPGPALPLLIAGLVAIARRRQA